MHPLKSFLRFSFLPRSLTRSNPSSPWKGKSTAPSLDITCPYNMDIDIPSPTPAPVLTQINLNPKADAIDDTPSLFCISEDADSNSDSDSDVAVNDSALDLHHVGWSGSVSAGSSGSGSGSGIGSSSRAKVVRVVSWASILSHRCRWTRRQERDLAIAERQLARCQKAWSSEQEVWLVYIKALTEEKEAHEDFLHQRAKQQGDEQQHFRKSWDRRRSSEEEVQQRSSFSLRRRLRRQGTT